MSESGTQHGYLVIADLSGYTSYVAKTELEHSQEILAELLEVLVTNLTTLLTLSKLEGDAVFGYVAESRVPRSESMLELVESTYVAFKDRMNANSKTNKATFWGDVRVLNVPWPEFNANFDLDKLLAIDLPEGAIFIRCVHLHVLDRPTQGKMNKLMEGHGRVSVQGRDFDASGQSIYYDQLKEQVILEGSESVPAVLRKEGSRPGAERQRFEGRKLIYNRKTGKIDGAGVSSINGESAGRR